MSKFKLIKSKFVLLIKNRWLRIISGLLVVVAIVGIELDSLGIGGPVYDGKPLSYWINRPTMSKPFRNLGGKSF